MRILLLTVILLVSSCEDIILEKDQVLTSTSGGSTTIDTSTLGAAAGGEEWIVVPANAGGMGLDAFAVMKYEAKAFNDANTNSTIDGGEVDTDGCFEGGCTTGNWGVGTHVPVSIADNQPWRRIDANNAAAECESLGANYHLISNPEWMAIAREVEMQDANWTGGTEGSGCLFRGNSGETACGYDGADPEQGTGRNARAKHVLSNAEEIYDISGNLEEWTDWDSDTVGFQMGPTSCNFAFYIELTAVACGALADADYNSNNGAYTYTDGMGFFTVVSSGTSGAALRGGNYACATCSGTFMLTLHPSLTYTDMYTGFRCVYRP